MSWENTFRIWAQPLSTTENDRCENAERMIRAAIKASPALGSMDIAVFAQGSYKSNTNVKQESDVDICVCLNSTFFYHLPPNDPDPVSYGIFPSSVDYKEFKGWVESALVDKFGRQGVSRGSKAFDVHANSYRVDADVVAAFRHHRYTGKTDGYPNYLEGIEFQTDSGAQIVNWPSQTYENGVVKNAATSTRYKAVVRVLKRLKYAMEEDNIPATKNIGSFLIACLVWNVPDNYFGHSTLEEDVRQVLIFAFNATLTDVDCANWVEVNELKYLFDPWQAWTRQQAHDFISAAWLYLGFT